MWTIALSANLVKSLKWLNGLFVSKKERDFFFANKLTIEQFNHLTKFQAKKRS